MSTSLHTVFTADAHLTEGQLLHEEPAANKGKSIKLREVKRMPTGFIKEGPNLHPFIH
jgi:hypothetical protein